MNTRLQLTVRRIDGRFRVVATDPEWLETDDGRFERNPDPIMEHTLAGGCQGLDLPLSDFPEGESRLSSS